MYGPRDTPRDRLGEEITELLRILSAANEQLGRAFCARNGLHPTDLAALEVVLHAEGAGRPATASDLIDALGLTSGAVTGVIDRLERAGHVIRHRDHADRRKVHLRYGETGKRLAGEFFGPLGALGHQVMGEFDESELATVHRFLTRMAAVTSTALAAID